MKMRDLMSIVEGKLNLDPRFQFHMSVEPDLVPGKSFAEQTRTVSFAGARGDAFDTQGDIYTTHNPSYWGTQMAREGMGDFPCHVYLVFVRNGHTGTIYAPHQDVSPPADVIVLAKVGECDPDSDDVPDYGRMVWLGQKWVKEHGAEAIERFRA